MLRAFLVFAAAVTVARADLPPGIKSAISGAWASDVWPPARFPAVLRVPFAGAIASSSEAAFELHVVPPAESNAELSRTIDSFAQATDADLAAGQQALQAQLREVLVSSGKATQMLVASTFAPVLVSSRLAFLLALPLLCREFSAGSAVSHGQRHCRSLQKQRQRAGSRHGFGRHVVNLRGLVACAFACVVLALRVARDWAFVSPRAVFSQFLHRQLLRSSLWFACLVKACIVAGTCA